MAYNERISSSNERAALTIILDGCYDALDDYPQTEEEDAALMENGRPSPSPNPSPRLRLRPRPRPRPRPSPRAGRLFTALPRNARMAIKLRRNEKR